MMNVQLLFQHYGKKILIKLKIKQPKPISANLSFLVVMKFYINLDENFDIFQVVIITASCTRLVRTTKWNATIVFVLKMVALVRRWLVCPTSKSNNVKVVFLF